MNKRNAIRHAMITHTPMSVSLLSKDYELSEKIASLKLSLSFVLSILEQARKSGNELQVDEFEKKKEEIDNEIKTLLK